MKIMRSITLCCAIMLGVAVYAAGVKVSDRGYTASAMVPDTAAVNGTVLAKDKLFSISINNMVLKLTVLDKEGKVATEITSPVKPGKAAIVFLLERIFNPAQGADGYRAIICLNGNRLGEVDRHRLALADTDAPLTLLPGKSSGAVEYSHAVDNRVIRSLSSVVIPRRWRPDTVNGVLLETPALILNVSKNAGSGNPLLGLFNKQSNSPLLVPGGMDWELKYKSADGASIYTNTSDFKFEAPEITQNGEDYQIVCRWHNDLFTVESTWSLRGSRFEADLNVKSLKGLQLQKVYFPRYQMPKLPGNDTVVVPAFAGQLAHNPTAGYRYRSSWPRDFCTMQFTAYYDDKENGIYIGLEDPSGNIKDVSCTGAGNLLETEWSVTVGYGDMEADLPGKAVLETYKGDWFDAGQIYKKFVSTTPWWIHDIPRKDTPEWFLKNPFWLGNFDYISHQDKINLFEQLIQFYELPMSLHTALLTSPGPKFRFGPDYVYIKGIQERLPWFKERNFHVGPYYNSRLFYADKDADKEYDYSNTGKHWALINENGSVLLENYGELHAAMCPGCPEWQQRIYQNVERIVSGGADYVYHDQLPCGWASPCFATNHGHKQNAPDAWLTNGHWITYSKIMGELRERYPQVAHTGEEGSEPYLKCLDGFMVWRFGKPNYVPLFHSIFAPRVQFVGRFIDTNVPSEYEAFFPQYGEQLVYNEQIGQASEPALSFPSPRRTWLKKLAHLRYAAVDFFIASEMLKPLRFRTKPETISKRRGIYDTAAVTSDKILHGVWKNIDGRIMIVFLNTVNEVQKVQPVIPFEYENMIALRENGVLFKEYKKELPQEVKLEPFAAEFWFFNVKVDDPDVEKVSAKLPFTARIMSEHDRGYIIQQKQDLSKVSEQDAVAAPLHAKDADWMLFAYRPEGGGIDFDARSLYKPYTYNWIAASNGAVVSYGKTFIGKNSKGVEIELATDEAGVTVEFVDMSAKHFDIPLAVIKPEKGEWFTFRKYKVEWKNPTANTKPHMVIRVKGGSCRIKGWQVFGTEK